jgi:hypothetical protein
MPWIPIPAGSIAVSKRPDTFPLWKSSHRYPASEATGPLGVPSPLTTRTAPYGVVADPPMTRVPAWNADATTSTDWARAGSGKSQSTYPP